MVGCLRTRVRKQPIITLYFGLCVLLTHSDIVARVFPRRGSFVSNIVMRIEDEEEKAGCFALIVFLMSRYCLCSRVIPRGAEGWFAMCVIVFFPDHTPISVTCGTAKLERTQRNA